MKRKGSVTGNVERNTIRKMTMARPKSCQVRNTRRGGSGRFFISWIKLFMCSSFSNCASIGDIAPFSASLEAVSEGADRILRRSANRSPRSSIVENRYMKESTKPHATLQPSADHKSVESSSLPEVAALIEQVKVRTIIRPNKISLMRSSELRLLLAFIALTQNAGVLLIYTPTK